MKKYLISKKYKSGPMKGKTVLRGKDGYFLILPEDRLPLLCEAPRPDQCYARRSYAQAIATRRNRENAKLVAMDVGASDCFFSVSEYNY